MSFDFYVNADKWVVFSDLHASRKTKNTIIETLNVVHRIAKERNTGIVFLGDFWHHRGALPVDVLTEVLQTLSTWTQPCVMLVGNHDQVNASGTLHALEALRLANPERIVVFDEPAVWRDAIWLPYRKDADVLKQTITSNSHRNIKTVFCHADVMGANVNATFQMKNGIDTKSAFSESIEQIISGHYHKPHFVERDPRVRYVGSPYQVSRAEKSQEKFLLVLDSKWQCEEMIKIDIGPRYFDVDETKNETIEEIENELRANDIVRWTIPFDSNDIDEDDYDDDDKNIDNKKTTTINNKKKKKNSTFKIARSVPKRVENARAKFGIQIEVRRPPAKLKSRIENAESLGPIDLFGSYAKSINLSDDAKLFCEDIINRASSSSSLDGKRIGDNVLDFGGDDDVVENKFSTGIDTGDDTHKLSKSLHHRKVIFDTVEITGFGAFKETVEYPLNDRGVVCIIGDNRDDSGFADSNGAGKTTLVTAVLWCLTGKSDVRLDTGNAQKYLTNKDVVNDDSKSAKVVVSGQLSCELNEGRTKSFRIERAVTRTKLSKLSVELNDIDETKLDSKATQEFLDQTLGATILAQTCFHGQHTIGNLLEASDAQLKQAFGTLVEQQIWQRCKTISKKLLKERREKLVIAKAEVNSRQSYVDRTKYRLIETERDFDVWKDTFNEKLLVATVEKENALEFFALDRMRNTRKAVEDVRLVDGIVNDVINMLAKENKKMDANTTFGNNDSNKNGNSKPPSSSRDEEQKYAREMEEEESKLLAKFNEAQRNEATARANAQQAHKNAGNVFTTVNAAMKMNNNNNNSNNSNGSTNNTFQPHEHEQAIDSETLKCTLCHQSIDPEKQKETFEELKKDAEKLRLVHVDSIASLNKHKQTLDKFQMFKKSEQERLLREERLERDMRMKTIELENRRMISSSELRRLSTLLRSVFNRFSMMLAYVPEEVLALEQNASTMPQQRKTTELMREEEEKATAMISSSSLYNQQQPRPPLSGIVLGLLDYQTPYTSAKDADLVVDFDDSNDTNANNVQYEYLKSLLKFDANSGLTISDENLRTFSLKVTEKVTSCERLVSSLEKHSRDYAKIVSKHSEIENSGEQGNPHFEALKAIKEQFEVERESLDKLKGEEFAEIEDMVDIARTADIAFSPTKGVSNYLFESALAEVSERVQEYVNALTGGALSLSLVSSSPGASDGNDDEDMQVNEETSTNKLEKIERVIFARKQQTGEVVERSLRQLSGGERRRLAIGLALAYADVSSRRLNVSSNLLILDEALQHLDSEGIERVVSVLRAIASEYDSFSSSSSNNNNNNTKTVLLTTQADSETEKMFDAVDAVVKVRNRAEVLLGGGGESA